MAARPTRRIVFAASAVGGELLLLWDEATATYVPLSFPSPSSYEETDDEDERIEALKKALGGALSVLIGAVDLTAVQFTVEENTELVVAKMTLPDSIERPLRALRRKTDDNTPPPVFVTPREIRVGSVGRGKYRFTISKFAEQLSDPMMEIPDRDPAASRIKPDEE